MAMHPSGTPHEVADAARRWLVRLDAQDCSRAEREAFQQWRASDPVHAAAYDELHQLWRGSAAIRHHDADFAAALQQARRPVPHRRTWLPTIAVAAALVLTVVTLLGITLFYPIPAVHYATGLGEQRMIQLQDGSTLVLDTDTEVQVRYGRGERALRLLSGQAEFEVMRDPRRPFVVHVGAGSVTAIGTRFQVRRDVAESVVTLLQGKVRVSGGQSAGGPQFVNLAPSERVIVGASGGLKRHETLQKADLARLQGWTEGQLVVRDWPLREVVAELNRYSATQLVLGDPGLADLSISGRFDAADPKTFAMSMEYGWPVRVVQTDAARIVLQRK